MSTIKRLHIRSGATWSDILELEASECARSCKRGLGPPRQAGTFEGGLEAVVAADLPNDVPLVPQGMVGMISFIVLGAFFLLREIEGALMMTPSVTLNATRRTVRFLLSASKTDPVALSVSREWGCVCSCTVSRAHSLDPPCPYHAAAEQLANVEAVSRETCGLG